MQPPVVIRFLSYESSFPSAAVDIHNLIVLILDVKVICSDTQADRRHTLPLPQPFSDATAKPVWGHILQGRKPGAMTISGHRITPNVKSRINIDVMPHNRFG